MSSVLLFAAGLIASLGFSLFQAQPTYQAALPSATALFETSLASPITSSATSMTLTANAIRGGGSLSGHSCFTIDEGSAQHEVVCGTVSGTAVSSMSRGISLATGTTTDSDNQFAHRRGANVKITDFPIIQILKAQANGEDTYNNVLTYATTTPDCASTDEICDYGFITDLAFSGAGVIDASTVAKGVVEVATQLEAASSTALGSTGATVVIPASVATSTWNSATAALRIPVTGNDGKIDNDFIATSTLYSGQTFSAGTTTIAGSLTLTGGNSTSNIASSSLQAFTSSTTPTTTWTKPANLKYVVVEVQGAGGGGGGSNGTAGGGGGGGGGYCWKIIPAVALGTTETVTVAAGGTGRSGTTVGDTAIASSFGSHCTANGGQGGKDVATPGLATGGTATGGDKNVSGSVGGQGITDMNIQGLGGIGVIGGYGGYGGVNSGAGANGGTGAVYVLQVFY